jgi:phospholipid-binding lipoprotein MlaA
MCPLTKKVLALLTCSILLCGCAVGRDPQDPLENWNRGMFNVNDAIDRTIVKPVAEGYVKVVPQPARTGVSNFFSNLGDIPNAFNNFLQFKITDAIQDLMRFAFNSTLGIFGLIDIASSANLPKHHQDFGQTLGFWGIGTGPYLVLPLLGPSTVRDAPGLLVDSKVDPVWQLDHIPTRNSLAAARYFDARVNLLGASEFAEKAAVDRYTFIRNLYLERRKRPTRDSAAADQKATAAPTKSRLQELDDDEDTKGLALPATRDEGANEAVVAPPAAPATQ